MSEESRIGDLANYNIFKNAHDIETSILTDNRVDKLLAWTQENKVASLLCEFSCYCYLVIIMSCGIKSTLSRSQFLPWVATFDCLLG